MGHVLMSSKWFCIENYISLFHFKNTCKLYIVMKRNLDFFFPDFCMEVLKNMQTESDRIGVDI